METELERLMQKEKLELAQMILEYRFKEQLLMQSIQGSIDGRVQKQTREYLKKVADKV